MSAERNQSQIDAEIAKIMAGDSSDGTPDPLIGAGEKRNNQPKPIVGIIPKLLARLPLERQQLSQNLALWRTALRDRHGRTTVEPEVNVGLPTRTIRTVNKLVYRRRKRR